MSAYAHRSSYSVAEYITPLADTHAVAVTAPLDGTLINAASFTVSWAIAATQDQYRIQVYDDPLGATLVYDSLWQSSATQSATAATGSALTSNRLYYLRVFVHTDAGESEETGITSFFFGLAASTDVPGVTVRPFPACSPSPQDNPGIIVSWQEPALSGTETFLCYEVRRRQTGETTYAKLARVFDQSQLSYFDAQCSPSTTYDYAVVYYADDSSSTQTVISAEQATPQRASIVFDWIYVHSLADPSLFLRISANAGTVTPGQDIGIDQTWGRQAPTAWIGEALSSVISLPGMDALRASPRQWDTLRSLQSQQAQTVLCLRLGYDREMYYCAMTKLSKNVSSYKTYAPTLEFQEVDHDEDMGLYEHTYGNAA